MAAAAARNQQEEKAWEVAAAAADDGRGINLRCVNLKNETKVQEIFDALNVEGIGPKSRLRAFIERLQDVHGPMTGFMTSSPTMQDIAGTWNTITEVDVKYLPHNSDTAISDAFNNSYSDALPDFDTLFPTDAKNILKPNAIDLIRTNLTTLITDVAVQTSDPTRIAPIVTKFSLHYKLPNTTRQLRTSQHFADLMTRAVTANQTSVTIWVNISVLKIDPTATDVNYLDFDVMSDQAYNPPPPTGNTGNTSHTGTNTGRANDNATLPPPTGKRPYDTTLDDIIDRKIARMQRVQRKKRPIRTLSYISKSAAFGNLTVQKRVKFNQPFFFDLISLPPTFSTKAFEKPGPPEGNDENKVHHARFIDELEKLVESFDTAAAKDESYAVTLLQRVLWTESGHWLKMDDGTEGVEPDFSFEEISSPADSVTPGKDKVVLPHSKYVVTVTLEQKKKISDKDQFEAIDHGERLLVIQDRSIAYTALVKFCDHRADIRWVEVFINNDEFHSRVTSPERLDVSGGTGQRQLLTVLSKTAAELGLIRPNPPGGFELLNKLDEGATSIVYEAQHNSTPAVLKIFKPGFEAYADHEARVLTHLTANHVKGVSAVQKVSTPVSLSLPEVLDRVEVISSDHMQHLVECLRGAHNAGVVHRDIRPENIMVDSLGVARVIDWGCAAFTTNGVAAPGITGTFRYASDEVLGAAINGSARTPEPRDDLECLVRAVLAVNTVTIGEELADLAQGDFQGARDYWRRKRAANTSYDQYFEAAARCDYETVKKLVFS